ncbi:hypothetical protein [Nitrososphaera viennensis]|uniref:SpoVT-AbrB domain-containing protein n=2 Tax=Nitrososphaera viennensis TaxID=1034015 RepID=A0A060HUG8_9ARCH|nr:hypothetical protein [Nitrososphaera viennensis]AIC16747.1 hypothetical protein NVIE_024820 [Nitrososphaera viennensis EN76]UVS68662.1 hypothetical protein NWT39_12245 [Nitrososphaera viennensis]
MPKWKKDATEFEVGVNFSEGRGAQSSIPKPVYDALGQPETIKFIVKNKHIEIEAGTATQDE